VRQVHRQGDGALPRQWEHDGIVDRELFRKAGVNGFLGMAAPEEHGGGGVHDFRYNVVIAEEIQRAGVNAAGLGLDAAQRHLPALLPDLCTDEQKARWLPGICSGELITAIAMTEPGIGSDLASMTTTATLDGDHYVVNGSKTFITNGINADLVITAVKTDPTQRHADEPARGRARHGGLRARAQPGEGRDARPGHRRAVLQRRRGARWRTAWATRAAASRSLVAKLPQERLSIAVTGVAAARQALDLTLDYVKERTAFGQPIGSFQNSRFRLAEMATEVEIAQTFVDRCVLALNAGELTAEEAAMAKWWCTELQKRVIDTCLQLHGGYGYMLEYPSAGPTRTPASPPSTAAPPRS
jgi:alkylation response protein AidB-like acyl-CoA dehydrogenase